MHFALVRQLPGVLEPALVRSIELPQPHSVLSRPAPIPAAYHVRHGAWHPSNSPPELPGSLNDA